MKAIIIIILKLIASVLVCFAIWFHILIALILWDDRFMQLNEGMSLIWSKDKKKDP